MNKRTRANRILAMILILTLLIMPAALAERYSAYVSDRLLVIYSDSSLDTRIGSLSRNSVVSVLEARGDTARISYFGKVGYAALDGLTRVDDVARVASVRSDTYVYRTASESAARAKVRAGTDVNVIAISGDWALVERNGIGAYLKAAQLTLTNGDDYNSNAQIVEVTASSVTVYASASTSSNKLGTMKKGAQLNLISSSGSWAYVELNGRYGYCKLSSLKAAATAAPTATPTPTVQSDVQTGREVTVTADKVTVYTSPSSASQSLGTMKKGAKLNLIRVNGSWAYVERDGRYGYCPASALAIGNASTPTATPVPSGDAVSMKVKDSSVKVYSQASDSSSSLGKIKKGQIVQVISTSGKWAYIMLNGNFGYVKLSSLTTYDPLEGYTRESFTATVVRNGTKLYASPSTSDGGTVVPIGADVAVTAYTSGWAYVQYGSSKGFMQTGALSRNSFTAVGSGSSGSSVGTLERALLLQGYFDGAPDTTYDTETSNAIQRFQQAIGQTVNGTASPSLQRVIFSGNAPSDSILSASHSKGDSGAEISRIQKRLLALKYLGKTSSVDGSYGTITANAISLFQAANGLSATGTADNATIRKLYSASAVSLPNGKKAADTDTVVQVSSGDQVANSTKISSSLASKISSFSESMPNSEKLEYVIYCAQNQLGKPYVFGATGTSSFDCSGLTLWSFGKAGISLKRTAYEQGYNDAYSKISSISSLKRGDEVFFNTVSDSDQCDHVGIYLGAGWFIHASSGQHKVVVSNITTGYYNRVFSWGRRILY